MVKQKEALNSLEMTKIGNGNNYGKQQGLATSYPGMKLRTRRNGFLKARETIDDLLKATMQVRSRKMTQR